MLTTQSIRNLYLSYLTPKEQKNEEYMKRIDELVEKDIKFQYKQLKKDAVRVSGKRKVIYVWSGKCSLLRRILSLRKK